MEDGAAEYRSLDEARSEIRSLVLEPGHRRDPIRCTLKHDSLLDDPKPEYRTISYVWGDASNRGDIFIAGRKTDVPASAERVLRRMRLTSEIRVLWIDAVCINQADVAERSQQVTIMGQIYANGIENLIWLGENDKLTGAFIQHMQDILEEFAADTQNFEVLKETIFSDSGLVLSTQPPRLSVQQIQLAGFFSAPWFKRLWVVQEASLAARNTCFCGEYELAFQDVVRLMAWVMWKDNFLLEFRSAGLGFLAAFWLLAGSMISYDPFAREGISHLIRSLRSFKATDGRDYIFGAVGLHEKLIGPFPQALKPDYTVSREVLFMKVVRHSIRQTGRLVILSYINRRASDAVGSLPSWVPHFDRMFDGNEDCQNFAWDFDNWIDTWKPAALHDDDEEHDQSCLALEGILLSDAVVYQNITVWGYAREHLESLSEFEEAASKFYAEPQSYLSKIADTVCAGKKFDDRTGNHKDSEHAYRLYKAFLEEHNKYPYWNYAASFRTEVEYGMAMGNVCKNRAFFVTSNGGIGLGPKLLRQGDVLAVLFGSKLPVALRPSAAHPGDFEFVGFAYVYGIMHGEVHMAHFLSGDEPDVIRLW